ncbi:MAG: NAD(P)/FAD-dependent oxidoreductase [Acidobacteria bacterium]|nr:NAD(P)/FAD-dependent oxidoreductase [Acidobacteriota bacterium]
MIMSKKVVIVGGGLAGLTAANFLAKGGSQITLFEKSRLKGGRAATFQKQGFFFNLGPHALYRGGQAFRILRELGVEISGGTPKVEGTWAIADGRKHKLPGKPLSLLTTSLLGIPAKLEAARVLKEFPKIDAAKVEHLTVREWLDRKIRNKDLRQFLQAFFRLGTYANDPERLSAGLALAQFQMALKESVLYLDGGWQTLVNDLRTKAEQAGVRIIPQSHVAQIIRNQSRQVTGVNLADGSSFPADAVIVATSPHEACEMLEGGEQTVLGEWAKNAIPVKAACLDVALERLPRPQATFALGIDRPLYLSVHSAAAKLTPEGKALIHVAMYLGSDAPNDSKAVEHELEELLELVQPGWQKLMIERRFMPSLTVVNALATAKQGGLSGRPGPAVPGIEGLFVAGDWVGTEGWLADASVASGKHAAQLAIGKPVLAFAKAA